MGSLAVSEVIYNTAPFTCASMVTHRTHESTGSDSSSSQGNTSDPAAGRHSQQQQQHRRSSPPTSLSNQSSSQGQDKVISSSTTKQPPQLVQDGSAKTPSGQKSPGLPPTDSTARAADIVTNRQSQSSTDPPSLPLSPESPHNEIQKPPPRIKVRDLQHIQSFVGEDGNVLDPRPRTPSENDAGYSESPPQYEISDMPVTDVIEMVAGLLTKITATNDQQHQHVHQHIPLDATANMSPQTSSVLAFHGKNVPSITIMSYLSRIHKYCPATYEVFLSLLVYFDRITERVNAGPLQTMRQSQHETAEDLKEAGSESSSSTAESANIQTESDSKKKPANPQNERGRGDSRLPTPPPLDTDPYNLTQFFVVDSFNIHRLVIAGVTCASKFFSDVFFTNSRYAKVGGLPLVELNHLELQFLLLNDFRLSIPVEELEAYATMLVEFYAREVVSQRKDESMQGVEQATG